MTGRKQRADETMPNLFPAGLPELESDQAEITPHAELEPQDGRPPAAPAMAKGPDETRPGKADSDGEAAADLAAALAPSRAKEEALVSTPDAALAVPRLMVRVVAPDRRRFQNYSFSGDPEQMQELEDLGREMGVARSDLIRQAIGFYLQHVDRTRAEGGAQ